MLAVFLWAQDHILGVSSRKRGTFLIPKLQSKHR